MENLIDALKLLFGEDPELRQIIMVTLRMSLLSTTISSIIGISVGFLLGSRAFFGKRLILKITSTMMGMPPVVAGLIVFLLLSRSGPLGRLKLLYSITAMVIAQVLLITPIITGLCSEIVSMRAPQVKETAMGIGLPPWKQQFYILYECKGQLISVVLTGFGRAISEVGAVQLVGGNIQYKTRVMTTAIMLETNMGHFSYAIALGIVLLIIAFVVNLTARSLEGAIRV